MMLDLGRDILNVDRRTRIMASDNSESKTQGVITRMRDIFEQAKQDDNSFEHTEPPVPRSLYNLSNTSKARLMGLTEEEINQPTQLVQQALEVEGSGRRKNTLRESTIHQASLTHLTPAPGITVEHID